MISFYLLQFPTFSLRTTPLETIFFFLVSFLATLQVFYFQEKKASVMDFHTEGFQARKGFSISLNWTISALWSSNLKCDGQQMLIKGSETVVETQ